GSRLCPACGAFAREGFEPLTNNYVKSGKVSWEFREFLIHGAPDLPPALLGICQGETIFFPLLEQMYQAQQGFNDKLQAMPPAMQQQLQNAKPVDAIKAMAEQMDLINFVKQRGIPEAKARQCLADMTQIDRLTKQTQDRGADGTVTGFRETRGWAPGRQLYFAMRFSRPLAGHELHNTEQDIVYKGFPPPGEKDPSQRAQ
ncbi:thioredoxin domain-containing protein, partial [Staphylococcus aureus]|nr:thioredoxin domain-containing protein [Staphylococcus aureus]